MITDKDIRQLEDKVLFKRLLSYAKPYYKVFIVVFLLMIFSTAVDVGLPLVLGNLIDNLASGEATIKYLVIIFSVFGLVVLVSVLIFYFQSMMLNKAGQQMLHDIRRDVFSHIDSLSTDQLNHIPVGKLVTRVTTDTNFLNELFTNVITNLVKNIITIVVMYVAMLFVSPKLTLYISIILPILVVASFLFRYFSRKAYREVRGNISGLNAFLSENLSGIKITQVFNQEEKKYNEFNDKNIKLRHASFKEIFVFAIFRPFIYLLYVSTVVIVIYFGSKEAIAGLITGGLLYTYYQYVGSLFNPLQQIADQYNQIQSALTSGERIFQVLDTEPTIINKKDPIVLDHIEGSIEFKHVYFAYTCENWVLKDLSFKINPKETVAFVGATGAGKSTILSLIVRNYDIQKGEILIDGINVKDIEISSLRRLVGQMLQDVFLFSGTIRTNITLFEDKFSEEEIKEACDFVNASYVINKMPKGLDEEVLERGNNFSQGERQLLSFARTIIHKPELLILDEATANIDTETEVLIQNSLNKMMNIGTMIIVAHRLSTIQHADNIIVLDHGEILEQGNHQALLKNKGHYYELYMLQHKEG